MRRDGRAEAAVALQERQRGLRKLGTEFARAAPPFFLLAGPLVGSSTAWRLVDSPSRQDVVVLQMLLRAALRVRCCALL